MKRIGKAYFNSLGNDFYLPKVVGMENHQANQCNGPTIRSLYPHLDAEQLEESEENLERYLAFALRLYERIEIDPEAYAKFKALTAPGSNSTMSTEKSSQT